MWRALRVRRIALRGVDIPAGPKNPPEDVARDLCPVLVLAAQPRHRRALPERRLYGPRPSSYRASPAGIQICLLASGDFVSRHQASRSHGPPIEAPLSMADAGVRLGGGPGPASAKAAPKVRRIAKLASYREANNCAEPLSTFSDSSGNSRTNCRKRTVRVSLAVEWALALERADGAFTRRWEKRDNLHRHPFRENIQASSISNDSLTDCRKRTVLLSLATLTGAGA